MLAALFPSTPETMPPLDLLNQRRSVPSRRLGAPGPDDATLERLLTAAIRAPDHGKLVPFRLITIAGDALLQFGQALANLHARKEPDAPPSVLDKDRERYTHAPLVVTVVARIDEGHPKIPAQEQLLSAGCVAYNLLLGAQSLGYGAQWLTGWAAYDRDVAHLLGLAADERVIAFVHIGTAQEAAPERTRPDLRTLRSNWTP